MPHAVRAGVTYLGLGTELSMAFILGHNSQSEGKSDRLYVDRERAWML